MGFAARVHSGNSFPGAAQLEQQKQFSSSNLFGRAIGQGDISSDLRHTNESNSFIILISVGLSCF